AIVAGDRPAATVALARFEGRAVLSTELGAVGEVLAATEDVVARRALHNRLRGGVARFRARRERRSIEPDEPQHGDRLDRLETERDASSDPHVPPSIVAAHATSATGASRPSALRGFKAPHVDPV